LADGTRAQEISCEFFLEEIFENKNIGNIVIHSHFSLTPWGAGLRVRALFRLFRYSSSDHRPQTLSGEAGFCQ
jgi:hypothetical protein